MDANVTPMDMTPDEVDGTSKRPPAPSADAGTDESIAARLEANPESKEARLDRALDESMDASDPPASTQPVHAHSGDDLPESSGYDPKAEAWLTETRHRDPPSKSFIGRLLDRLGVG